MPMFIRHRLARGTIYDNRGMNAGALTRTLQEFLSNPCGAVVLEDHAVAFDP